MNNNQDFEVEPLGSKGQSFNFKHFAGKIRANWFWIFFSVLVCITFAYFYLRYTTPIYSTKSKILINNDNTSGGQAAVLSELSGIGPSSKSIENDIVILQTKQLMQKVVKDLNANVSYYHKGRVQEVELYPAPFVLKVIDPADTIKPVSVNLKFSGDNIHLFNNALSKNVKFYQPFQLKGIGMVQLERQEGEDIDGGDYSIKISSLRAAAGKFTGSLSVKNSNKLVNIIDLEFTSPVPKKSEDILNKLVQKYVEETQLNKNQIADSTIAFIENRLLYVGQELGDIEGNVQAFKQNNKLTDINQQASMLVSSGSEYVEQLASIETQLSVLDAIRKYLADENNKRVIPSGALIEDQTFTTLITRYNTLIQERDRSGLSQTADNPYIKNLEAQISSVREDMLGNFDNLKNTLTISRNRLRSRANVVAGQVKNVPSIERTFLDLARQQQIKQELYIYLLQKKEEIAISKTSNVSNCKVIELPASSGPISPKGSMILLFAVFIGLSVPLLTLYLAQVFNTRVNTKEDIANLTHVPVIGEINTNDDQEMIVSKSPRSPISEQFRALRTNLSFFLKKDEKVILITSSFMGEGKSFVTINLATVLAMSGKKVVMIELDLRKPNLSNKLNLSTRTGLTNYIISSELRTEDVVLSTDVHENLYVISCGPIPPNPAEIILNERMDELIADLQSRFDYVIIDTPPVGMVTDAQLLSKYSDLTLYLVRQRYTYKEQLNIPEEIYLQGRMKNIALVINDVALGQQYGYGYGYGYGNEEDQNTKKGFLKRIFKG